MSPLTGGELPPAFVTTTWIVFPVVPAGEVTVIEVSLLTVNEPLTPPNLTDVVPVKNLPVIVTVVPPLCVPLVGLML